MIKTYYYCDRCEKLLCEEENKGEYEVLSIFSHTEPSGAGDSDSYFEKALFCQECLVDFVQHLVGMQGVLHTPQKEFVGKDRIAVELKKFKENTV
jgi:hypothetical protein